MILGYQIPPNGVMVARPQNKTLRRLLSALQDNDPKSTQMVRRPLKRPGAWDEPPGLSPEEGPRCHMKFPPKGG